MHACSGQAQAATSDHSPQRAWDRGCSLKQSSSRPPAQLTALLSRAESVSPVATPAPDSAAGISGLTWPSVGVEAAVLAKLAVRAPSLLAAAEDAKVGTTWQC